MDTLKTAFEHHSLCMTMITDVLMYMVGVLVSGDRGAEFTDDD